MAQKRKKTVGQESIDWIQKFLRVPEGMHIGRQIKLRPWQKRALKRIYDNPHGTRRAIISFGRKNGKTTLAACLLLLHLCGPRSRYNSQLYSGANAQKQAAALFKLAAKMVRMSPELMAVVVIRDNNKELFCPKRGTLYQALSAEAATAFGLSPVFMVHDELGQVRGPQSQLYEALETATGAQDEPLSVIISTQAPTDNDLLSVLIDDALLGHDKSVICELYTAPMDEDPFSIKAIKKANPAYGDFLNRKEALAMAEDARRMPSREAEYRNLILNQRVDTHNPFITKAVWDECGSQPIEDFSGLDVFAALDLSATRDLTAMMLIAFHEGKWHVKPYFWLPEDGLIERSRQDRRPYDTWARQGYLQTTPGRAIDYDWVATEMRNIFDEIDVKKVAFDRWKFDHFKPCLLRAGFSEEYFDKTFVEFGQGFKSMSPALRALEKVVLDRQVAHGGHPVLAMCASNAVISMDPAGERKLNKVKSRGRIDGMVALAMAVSVAVGPEAAKEPEYQMIFV